MWKKQQQQQNWMWGVAMAVTDKAHGEFYVWNLCGLCVGFQNHHDKWETAQKKTLCLETLLIPLYPHFISTANGLLRKFFSFEKKDPLSLYYTLAVPSVTYAIHTSFPFPLICGALLPLCLPPPPLLQSHPHPLAHALLSPPHIRCIPLPLMAQEDSTLQFIPSFPHSLSQRRNMPEAAR